MNPAWLGAALSGAALIVATAITLNVAVDSPRSLMTPTDYERTKRSIRDDAQAAYDGCRNLEAGERGLCQSEARAGERIRKADLDASYLGTVNAASEARIVRVKARYEMARARCSETRGADRIACLRQAGLEKAKAADEGKAAASS
jgi:hypothetical protein